MTISEEEKNFAQEEFKWIDFSEYSEKSEKSKGILGILVPLGCIATAGVLTRGLYFLYKGNSIKQQKMMRYRVLSQGITIILTTIGLLKISQ